MLLSVLTYELCELYEKTILLFGDDKPSFGWQKIFLNLFEQITKYYATHFIVGCSIFEDSA